MGELTRQAPASAYLGERARWSVRLLQEVLHFDHGLRPPEMIAEGQWRVWRQPSPWDAVMGLPAYLIWDDEQLIEYAEWVASDTGPFGSLDKFIASSRAKAVEDLRHG